MKILRIASASAALLISLGSTMSSSWAADIPLKAPPVPVMTWTGFYAGGQIGGGWATRDVTYTPDDILAAALLPASGGFFPNSFRMSGATGGIEAGYNWQFSRNWLLGAEIDISAADLQGSGNSTSPVLLAPGLSQTVSEQERIDRYGTVRARFGWLPSDNLLLFATGGLAYGHVSESGSFTGVGGGLGGGFSFLCPATTPCFVGPPTSLNKTGWTAGGGAEWMFAPHWSAKVEYQYVDLGRDAFTQTAVAVLLPGNLPSSFNVNARDDFHVVRVGLNYHF